MDCERVIAIIGRYFDRELASVDAIAVMRHARVCPNCRAEIERGRRLAGLLREDSVPIIPDDFAMRVVQRARQQAPLAAQEFVATRESLANHGGRSRTEFDRIVSGGKRSGIRSLLNPRWVGVVSLGLFGVAIGMVMSGQTWDERRTGRGFSNGSSGMLAPITNYGLGSSTSAPQGSLADAYITLVSSPENRSGLSARSGRGMP